MVVVCTVDPGDVHPCGNEPSYQLLVGRCGARERHHDRGRAVLGVRTEEFDRPVEKQLGSTRHTARGGIGRGVTERCINHGQHQAQRSEHVALAVTQRRQSEGR